ncbi:MAG: hypothetical protein V1837_06585 [Candidatus Woesearchaeota archaeon]
MDSSVIETGVDKLVDLVKVHKRISVPDAAKMLSVSKVVVEEWADFLEEEGIISIEYKFTTAYLVERVLSKKEVDEKIKDFKGKKEGFVRKAEVARALLADEGQVFSEIKGQFKKLKDDLGHDLVSVQEELKQLEEYNKEKRNIDEELRKQEKDFKDKISDMESQIGKERDRYGEILAEVKKEQEVLNKDNLQALSMQQTIRTAEASVAKFQDTVKEIRDRLSAEAHEIDDVEDHVKRLKNAADDQRKDIENRKKQMEELIQRSEQQKKKIADLQENIIKRALSKKKILDKGGEAGKSAEKIKKFLSNNKRIEDYLDKVNAERDRLHNEFDDLIRKAKAFNLMTKSGDVKNLAADLQKRFKQLEKDKDDFEKEAARVKEVLTP